MTNKQTQAGAINTAKSIFGVNSFLEGIRGADSRRSRYNDVPRTYREAPPATAPPATAPPAYAPSAAATAPPATVNPRVDDDEGTWEPASEDEIDPEFTVIDESSAEMPMHAGFNSLGIRVRGVDADDYDDDDNCNKNDSDDSDNDNINYQP